MTGLERLGWGRVWILETLFQIAEEYDCMIDDFQFIALNREEQLLINTNGSVVRLILPLSEIEACTEEGTFKAQMLSSRARIKRRLRELMTNG
jgi:hypothetical protein